MNRKNASSRFIGACLSGMVLCSATAFVQAAEAGRPVVVTPAPPQALSPVAAERDPGKTKKRFSLAELQALALSNSPLFQVIDDQIAAARAGVGIARAYPNPELEMMGGPSSAKNDGVSTGQTRSNSLVQSIDLPNRRGARIGAAEFAYAAAQAGGVGDRAMLMAQLQLRYYELLRRLAEFSAASEDLSLIQAIRDRIAKRVEVGDAPRFELIKIETETLNVQKSVQTSQARVQQARAVIRQLVGQQLPTDFEVEGKLTDIAGLPPLEEVRESVLRHNPDLRKARAEVRQYEDELNHMMAQRWPDLAVKAGLDEDQDLRTNRFGLVLRIPLWDWKSGPIAQARANLERARHSLSQKEFGLGQDLNVAYQGLDISRYQVDALENGIIKQAEMALKIAETAYRFGERSFIEVLDSQRVFRSARNELITARYEYAAAFTEITRLRAQASESGL